MAWEASPFFRSIYSRLVRSKASLHYVHRFDHWLEMNVKGADIWQKLSPGHVIDYTTVFRGGVCLGSAQDEAEMEDASAGAFAAPAAERSSRGCATSEVADAAGSHDRTEAAQVDKTVGEVDDVGVE